MVDTKPELQKKFITSDEDTNQDLTKKELNGNKKEKIDFYYSSEDDVEENQDENWDHIYDLPKMDNITKTVMVKLIVASVIALIFLIAEVVGGILSSSLAILSDAAHMFSDLSGFFISIFSVWIGTKPASLKLSYGYHRAEVIGALASIVLIWGLTILLLYEATHRIINKEAVEEPLYMLITAGFGLFCNVVMAKVLHSAPGHSHHGCSHGHSHGAHHDHRHENDHNHDHDHDHDHKHGHDEIDHNKNKKKQNKKEDKCSHDHDHNHDHNHENGYQSDDEQKHSPSENKQNNNISNLNLNNRNKEIENANKVTAIGVDNKKEHSQNCNHKHDEENGHSHSHSHDHDHKHGNENQKTVEKKINDRQLNINAESYLQNTENNLQNNEENAQQAIIVQKENKKNKNLSLISAKENYNLRAAMIHVIGDIIQSVGVLVSAILIYLLGGNDGFNYWHYADPICTYIFSILVLFTTFSVSRECIKVLMEGSPNEINVQEFKEQLLAIEYVQEIHDLHIWSLSKGKPSMTCHLFVTQNPKKVLRESTRLCRLNGIYHSTIQIEEFGSKGSPAYIKCDHNIHY